MRVSIPGCIAFWCCFRFLGCLLPKSCSDCFASIKGPHPKSPQTNPSVPNPQPPPQKRKVTNVPIHQFPIVPSPPRNHFPNLPFHLPKRTEFATADVLPPRKGDLLGRSQSWRPARRGAPGAGREGLSGADEGSPAFPGLGERNKGHTKRGIQ